MKLTIFLILILYYSCSSARIERDFTKKRLEPCSEKMMKNKKEKSGWFCYDRCIKYKFLRRHKTKNCKYWKTDMYDLKDLETFKKFRNAKFILIQENRID